MTSLISQFVGGIGAGGKRVALTALVVEFSEKNEYEKNIGLTEAAVGCAYLAGPIIGSIMFAIGGY